jgi:uncharacterized membrane protein YkvA (DUF1232 family)
MENAKYVKEYSESSFWDKIKNFAKKAGCELIEKSVMLYYVAKDDETPASAKALIFGALGYFISPIDLIPDITPVIGFGDDLTVLSATILTVVNSIKDEHKEKAKKKIKKWC